MAADGPAVDDDLRERYPALYEFFSTTLWPDVDGDNLLELLHRVLAHWHPERVRSIVAELGQLREDTLLDDEDLVEVLTRRTGARPGIVDAATCRPFLDMVAGFAAYLHDEGGLRGAM